MLIILNSETLNSQDIFYITQVSLAPPNNGVRHQRWANATE